MTSVGGSVKMALTSDHERKPGKRGAPMGWSNRARSTIWTYLNALEYDRRWIEQQRLYEATLTFRECPPNAEATHSVLHRWFVWAKKCGHVVWAIWLMEWHVEKREQDGVLISVPHFHLLLLLDDTDEAKRWAIHDLSPGVQVASRLLMHWCKVSTKAGYGSQIWGQDLAPIRRYEDYAAYLVDHAGRGKDHPQRNPDALPASWEGKTGRVVGKVGLVPLGESIKVRGQHRRTFYQLRRRVWRMRRARAAGYVAKVIAEGRRRLGRPGLSYKRLVAVADARGYDLLADELDRKLRQSLGAVRKSRCQGKVSLVQRTAQGAEYCLWPARARQRQISEHLGVTYSREYAEGDPFVELLAATDASDRETLWIDDTPDRAGTD